MTRWSAVLAALAVGAASATVAQEGAVPAQPSDPVAAKAYGVFDQSCAGCHQTGRLKTLLHPAGDLATILDLDKLAGNAALVTPGRPDLSPLFQSLQSRAMPPPVAKSEGAKSDSARSGGDDATPPLTASDLLAVRDWIEGLDPNARCADRPPVAALDIAQAVSQASAGWDADRARRTRFLSLVPLRNACAGAAELESARQAVVWLVNALSTAKEPLKFETVGPENLLIAIDIAAIGWDADRWDRLAERAPATPFRSFDEAATAKLGTKTPVLDGDWLAAAATEAPLYYELLGLPETLSALQDSLHIDVTDLRHTALSRIAIAASPVGRGNRLIERRSFANGAAWFASDFAPTAGRPDLFEQTVAAAVAPAGPKGEHPQPHADASLVHFDLPNGFPAFYAASAAGARSNDVPQSVLRDDARPGAPVAIAQSCLGCHANQAVATADNRADDLRSRLQANQSLAKDVRDKLLALEAEPADFARKIADDKTRFGRALAAAGIDPLRRWDGLTPLAALIARYHRAVTAEALADTTGMSVTALLQLRRTAKEPLAEVLARLAFGPVPRRDVDAVTTDIAQARGLTTAPIVRPGVVLNAGAPAKPALVLTAAAAKVRQGDLLVVDARTDADCYLTLVDVDTKGRGTVLFPNEFDRNNLVDAGHTVRIPNDKAPYQFRLGDKGAETVIGVCAPTPRPVDGIRHNFEFQHFTELGDWRAYLNRNWNATDSGETKSSKAPPSRPASAHPLAPDTQLRTAIRVVVE